jgi:hypothetical protein
VNAVPPRVEIGAITRSVGGRWVVCVNNERITLTTTQLLAGPSNGVFKCGIFEATNAFISMSGEAWREIVASRLVRRNARDRGG